MNLIALLFLPAAAAVGYCNDLDSSCAAWGKAGECTAAGSECPLAVPQLSAPVPPLLSVRLVALLRVRSGLWVPSHTAARLLEPATSKADDCPPCV